MTKFYLSVQLAAAGRSARKEYIYWENYPGEINQTILSAGPPNQSSNQRANT